MRARPAPGRSCSAVAPFLCRSGHFGVRTWRSGRYRRTHARGGVLVETIATVPVPVIAAVEGMALGGGFEVVLAADLVVAGDTAEFGLPEASWG